MKQKMFYHILFFIIHFIKYIILVNTNSVNYLLQAHHIKANCKILWMIISREDHDKLVLDLMVLMLLIIQINSKK